MEDMYDPDDVGRSPPPQRQVIDYRVRETPPPRIPSVSPPPSSQNDPSGPSRKSPIHRREIDPVAMSAAALISNIDPNRPEIARWELEERERRWQAPRAAEKGNDIKDTTAMAQDALAVLQGAKPVSGSPTSPELSDVKAEEPGDVNLQIFGPQSEGGSIPEGVEQRHRGDDVEILNPQDHSPRTAKRHLPNDASPEIIPKDESSATSPNLRKYTINQSDRPERETLPRLQPLPLSKSPNPSESSQNLPSLQSTLGTQLKESPMNDKTNVNGNPQRPYAPVGVSSPPRKHSTSIKQENQPAGHYLQPQQPPSYTQTSSPNSKDMSSLSPPSQPAGAHPSYWRPPPKSESYVTSPFDPGSVGSQQTGDSPSTGYPTPTDHMTATEAERLNVVSGSLQSNGPLTSSGFKCAHPGCNAQFQTQYLLK
ncbi:hypothetical protein FQN54_008244 [Arachnomyces sp. PD_36]|nr:hypothetical protein FQN54_008244 [Arachnomyces sp. PD_36]